MNPERIIVPALVIIFTLSFVLAISGEPIKKTSPVKNDTSDFKTPNKLPKILDLGSKSCIPCKAMAPILDSLSQAYKGKADVEFIDVKENRQASIDHKITLIPTQIFFDTTGTEVFRHIGFFPADSIKVHLKQVGAKL
jgi:thioredoxin 1